MSMTIGAFRRHVAKTTNIKATRVALRTVAKNTIRMQVAQATVGLNVTTGRLLQVTSQYLLGLQQTQEMKDDAFNVLGDVGYELTALARALKVKLPSATKKSRLVGTRGAAILQLASMATDLLRPVEEGLFMSPEMMTVTKMVSIPTKTKGEPSVKEERPVDVVNTQAEAEAEAGRQVEMLSFLSAAADVYWRLCYDMTGKTPSVILDAKFARMEQEYPEGTFDTAVTTEDAEAPETETTEPATEAAPSETVTA